MQNYLLLIFLFLTFTSFSQIDKSYEPGLQTPIETFNGSKDNMQNIQPLIDALNPGDVLKLKPGFYYGPGYIKTPNITIDGQGKATISGRNLRSVLYIEADNVTIKNLHLIESGDSHDQIDCAIKINKSKKFKIINNKIEETLFGIDVFWSDGGLIKHNDITSISKKQKGLKGDAIRFWYSKDNLTQENYWHQVRDMVVWYSESNHFVGNYGEGNRYSIHFMYSHKNQVSHNHFQIHQ
jgi:nitrous oxidase accessory protein